MTQSGETLLLSLLEGGGRKLINFKFLPGDNPTSGDALCGAAYSWLSQVLARPEGDDQFPIEAVEPASFDEALVRF